MVKIKSIPNNTISVGQLQDGQIAQVTLWRLGSGMEGKIIQRLGNHLIIVGGTANEALWDALPYNGDESRVRVLPPGTLLEV